MMVHGWDAKNSWMRAFQIWSFVGMGPEFSIPEVLGKEQGRKPTDVPALARECACSAKSLQPPEKGGVISDKDYHPHLQYTTYTRRALVLMIATGREARFDGNLRHGRDSLRIKQWSKAWDFPGKDTESRRNATMQLEATQLTIHPGDWLRDWRGKCCFSTAQKRGSHTVT